MICEAGDVVLVPIPFVDLPVARRRPAVVISGRAFNEAEHQSVLAMVTTAAASSWASDTPLTDLPAAGLVAPCVVRLKIFTLENRLLERLLGALGQADRSGCPPSGANRHSALRRCRGGCHRARARQGTLRSSALTRPARGG